MRIVVDLAAALIQAMRGKDEQSMPTPVSRARTGEWGRSRRNSAHLAVRQNAVTFTKRSISEHQTANLGSGVRISSGAPLCDFVQYRCLPFANTASSSRQPHVELVAGRLGVAQQRLGARQRLAALQSGNGGLAGPHPASQFSLREARPQTSLEQFGRNLELRSERVILGLDLGVGQQASLELLEWDCHVISFARRSARSISARGVFCVFFTNARTTTTRRPIAVT